MTVFWLNLMAFLAKTSPYWGLLLGAFFLSLLLTPLCRACAIRLGMVDQPSARRINKVPVPRGGGLAIFVSLVATLYVGADVLDLFPAGMPSISAMHRLMVLSGMLCLLGLADDKFSLPPLVKLGGQIAVALGAYFWAHVSFGFHYPMLLYSLLDVQAVGAQRLDVVVDAFPLRADALRVEVGDDLSDRDRVLRVGVLEQVIHEIEQLELLPGRS